MKGFIDLKNQKNSEVVTIKKGGVEQDKFNYEENFRPNELLVQKEIENKDTNIHKKTKKEAAQKRAKEHYDKTHEIINGILYKQCNKHEELFPEENDWFPCTEEYFYINKTNKSDGLHPECKRCGIKKADNWQKSPENKEAVKKSARKRNSKPDFKIKMKRYAKEQRENGYQKQYQQNNKEKFKAYNRKREQNKLHKINKKEWKACLEYFNNQCAYCGMTLEEHKNLYNQQLHKEHVDHNGSNTIENCVPACKSCNSKKWEFILSDWYNENNPKYSKERLEKINKWINGDYKNIY